MARISELHTFSPSYFQDLSGLMKELNKDITLREESLKRMLEKTDSHLYVVQENGHIVACASLCVYHQPWQTDGTVESVVVSPDCRGRGFGRELMQYIISEAQRLGLDELHLTSRPSRIAANALYKSMGFLLRETNCYVLYMQPHSS